MTTTFKINDITNSFITALETTGFKFGDGEMPKVAPAALEPFGIVYTIAGGSAGSGSMANPNDMGTIAFQIRLIGRSIEQCRGLQQKYMHTLETSWTSISGCLGPAKITVGGIVKEDERTFVANDTLYMEVTGV